MGFSWVATAARTGEIITDLTNLDLPTVKQTVGRYETAQARLPINIEDAPSDWVRATKKNASHLILLGDNPEDPAHGIPIIGYRITKRVRDESDVCQLDVATLESYLDCRYIGDETYTQVGQNDIFADLIEKYILDGDLGGSSGKNGIPIRVQYATAGVGKLRDHTYKDQDDKTVYSALTDMAGVIGGFEWYLGWEWQHNPERITPVAYVGERVGTAPSAGLDPAATFEMPGPVTSFRMVEDYGQGKGANDVMATSSGQGTVRPQSAHETITDADQPTVEYRFTPSTSITNVSTLDDHATSKVAVMADGATTLSLSYSVEDGPRLGIDYFLGDDVGYNIGGKVKDPSVDVVDDVYVDIFTDRYGAMGEVPANPDGKDSVPAFPGGIKGTARVAGYELALKNTPIASPLLVSSDGSFDD